MQRAAGGAALLQALLVPAPLAIALVDPGDGGASAALLQALEAVKVLQAGAGLVLVFGLAERLLTAVQDGAGGASGLPDGRDARWLVWLAVAAGAIGAALLLAAGGVGYASLVLFSLFPGAENAPGATALPLTALSSALNAVVSGLGSAAAFASGGWAVLAGWAGRRTGRLSPSLGALLLLWGVVGMLAFFVPELGLPAALLSLVALGWLGAVLLRRSAPAGAPA